MGVRRPVSCGPVSGTDRLLLVRDLDGMWSPTSYHHPNRTVTVSAPLLREYSPFDRVRWRGDPNSFVDVFDVPILTLNAPDRGARFGNVVRLLYPRSAVDPNPVELDLEAEFTRQAAQWHQSPPQWGVGRAFRMYDIGECSGAVSWRDLGEGFAAGADQALFESEDATEAGQWALTFELRQEFRADSDQFTFTRPYEVCARGEFGECTEIDIIVRVQLVGRFVALDDQLRFRMLRGVVLVPESVAGPAHEREFTAEQRAIIEQAIAAGALDVLAQPLTGMGLPPNQLRCTPGEQGDQQCFQRVAAPLEFYANAPVGSARPHNFYCGQAGVSDGQVLGECRFVPNVHRVNHRVDGVSLVLSETDPAGADPDPFYVALQRAGTCHGFRVGAGAIACVHDGLFEVTSPGNVGIRFCGDALLSR